MKKLVSVIIPCYNSEKFVSRAIESVLAQTHVEWELILVNNNSVDSTLNVLTYYQKKNPEKIYIYEELKAGAPAARNKGLLNAKGEWIQFLDADDEIFTDKLERQLNLASNNDGNVISGCYFFISGLTEKKLFKGVSSGNVWLGLIKSQLGITSANLWERSKLIEVGGWDETLTSSQEYNLLFRILVSGGLIKFDETPSCNVYAEENSISRPKDISSRIKVADNLINSRLKIRQHLIENNLMTKKLKTSIDLGIYKYLMTKRIYFPDHAMRLLRHANPKVPWWDIFYENAKHNIKIIFQIIGVRKWK